MAPTGLTPLMQQYYAIKQQHPDLLLLFQVGDFYELFFADAQQAAACLGIALTKRGNVNGEPIPLCGVPVHALDAYLPKLVRAGFKVALCDQLEEAQPGKVVERGVTKILTPGTLTDANVLDAKSASYLLSFFPHESSRGLLFGELLTAQLFVTVLPPHADKMIESELARFFPDEILVPDVYRTLHGYFQRFGYYVSFVPDSGGFHEEARSRIDEQSQHIIEKYPSLNHAWLNFYAYVQRTNPGTLAHALHMQWYAPDDFLLLDSATQRNLELVKNMRDGGKEHTLFDALDGAATAMGSRTIKKWIMRPLVDVQAIEQRAQLVEYYVAHPLEAQRIEKLLTTLGDIERVVGRIALKRAHLQDYRMLSSALGHFPIIRSLVEQIPLVLAQLYTQACIDFSALHHLLEQALNNDLAYQGIIKPGYDPELDRMRDLVEHGAQKIIELEQAEQQATGIASLKIRYNNVHGYYIEITKTHYDAIPPHYIRRQTLVGRERFVTQELQLLEQHMHTARTDIAQHEKKLFDEVVWQVSSYVPALRKTVHALAHLDAIVGLACRAYEHGYVRPQMVATRDLVIMQGRHPVVERVQENRFVANDTHLHDQQSLLLITGPNMGGKSTYLRQVALITIMAHIGSFVPAQAAAIPIIDRIFTRIGAGDNLAQGKSTFLVEMEETAAICTQATQRSLVILDEVGRGTSTFDGLAIAQAVVEHIYTNVQARCLFATHYHELTSLQDRFQGIKSYYAASKKSQGKVTLLYKIVQGVADGSFGIEVAKLAAMPSSVIERAEEILEGLAAPGIYSVPVKQKNFLSEGI